MTSLARPLFIVLLVISATVIISTTGQLPEQVASHFGASGTANSAMTRSGYLMFMLAFALAIPLLVVLSMAVLPRLMGNAINIPNRDYWLAPARREATLRYLGAHACWLGSLLTVFIAAIHLLLLEANATRPPHLPAAPFWTLLALFLAAMAFWAITLVMRFRQRS
jgi:uncharacterized membrane protein